MMCAVAVLSYKLDSGTLVYGHRVMLLDVNSEDEARGVGHRLAEMIGRQQDGFKHDVEVDGQPKTLPDADEDADEEPE